MSALREGSIVTETLLKARPYWISSDAPAANRPEDRMSWLEIYLVTGLLGDVVVERVDGVEPPTDCAACGNPDTISVRVRGQFEVGGRDEWYCPECGASENDLPLATETRLWYQPLHWLGTVTMLFAWVCTVAWLVGILTLVDCWHWLTTSGREGGEGGSPAPAGAPEVTTDD